MVICSSNVMHIHSLSMKVLLVYSSCLDSEFHLGILGHTYSIAWLLCLSSLIHTYWGGGGGGGRGRGGGRGGRGRGGGGGGARGEGGGVVV